MVLEYRSSFTDDDITKIIFLLQLEYRMSYAGLFLAVLYDNCDCLSVRQTLCMYQIILFFFSWKLFGYFAKMYVKIIL